MVKPSTPEQKARYLANPRQCIDCGGKPSAGRPRCDDCHKKWERRGRR
ncbi:hypothetical protein SEA_CRACKLEWINK_74 [Mycobacterium phage Cracklewink]|nr:hypothetical protein SEA_CRACKLEWINK_74 [Mycobacterium phage Cracklewink]